MATSKPVTWLISDVINWFKSKELIINENFQRHSVWSPQAKTLLIDSILNELPLPKIFIRTKIDPKRQKTIKEIVDGQQRIRSIVEFANDEFALNSKSENFIGKKYSDLSDEAQQAFLGYILTAEQLLNASDDDVIDIFARLNSYTVALNANEKRHAAFQTELKFFVRRMSIKYRWFLEKYSIFTIKQRFRMADDEFFAELTRLIMNGIQDGGADRITKFYQVTTDDKFNDQTQKKVEDSLDRIITYLDSNWGVFFNGSLGKHYQIYSLIAAYLHINGQIPRLASLPQFSNMKTKQKIIDSLGLLEQELDNGIENEFTKASSSSPHRIANRIMRTKSYINAIGV
jgi:hypothetical protein